MEDSTMPREERLLRLAFLLGAVTDALALIPMLSPPMTQLLWGFRPEPGPYSFAIGYAAALMFGWTLLLLWAYRRPLERRFVAALTVFVIYGLVAAEIVAVARGDMALGRMLPTWCLQSFLLVLFASAYHHSTVRRWFGAAA
jgi:hypothetical protein